MSNADEIIKLKELLDNNIITQEEFNKKKTELLNINDNIEKVNNPMNKLGIKNNITLTSNKNQSKKKNSHLGVIIFLLFIVFAVVVGSFTDKQYEKESQIKELLNQYSISYEEVDSILKKCGFSNYTLEKSIDNDEVEGSIAFKIQENNIIAFMDIKDGKIYSIQYGDKFLYENGAIQHTLSENTQSSSNTQPVEGEYTTSDGKFTLVSDEGNKDTYGYITITGEIKNNTNKLYTYAQVTFTLYDESGAQVGTAMDNINNFEANGTWKFKAIGIANGSATYKCTGITGW